MGEAGVRPAQSHLNGLLKLGERNPRHGGLETVDVESHLGLIVFDVPVDIDNAPGFIEHVPDLPRQFDLAVVIRPVDFRNQGLKHRRAVLYRLG